MWTAALCIAAGICAVMICTLFFRIKRRALAAVSSSAMGLLSLLGINALAGMTGIWLGYSALSLLCTAALGVPGVVGLLFFKVMWKV